MREEGAGAAGGGVMSSWVFLLETGESRLELAPGCGGVRDIRPRTSAETAARERMCRE